jgi:lysine 2,3-aminomutase
VSTLSGVVKSNSDLRSPEKTGSKKELNESKASEEPPGHGATSRNQDEEPPGKRNLDRNRFFAHIPNDQWNDWRWHFRNRVTGINQLTRFIPLSPKERAQLNLVTLRYPISVTPYYLSLMR